MNQAVHTPGRIPLYYRPKKSEIFQSCPADDVRTRAEAAHPHHRYRSSIAHPSSACDIHRMGTDRSSCTTMGIDTVAKSEQATSSTGCLRCGSKLLLTGLAAIIVVFRVGAAPVIVENVNKNVPMLTTTNAAFPSASEHRHPSVDRDDQHKLQQQQQPVQGMCVCVHPTPVLDACLLLFGISSHTDRPGSHRKIFMQYGR